MPKVTSQVNSLTAGEWSRKALGRFDLAKYQSGAKKLENFLIRQLGGAMFRPGTRYVTETKDSSLTSRLFPFQYSADQDYVVEAGDQYFRLYNNDASAVTVTSYDEYTKLLMHMDGIDGSTSFIDEIGHAVTPVGDAQIGKGGSLLLDGDSDYLTFLDSDDWDFGTGDFTIDMWLRFGAINADQAICAQFEGGTDYWIFYIDANNKLYMYFIDNTTVRGAYIMTSAWSGLAINVWHHVAFVRSGTTGYIFIDGVAQTLTEAVSFGTNNTGNYTSALWVGDFHAADHRYFNGWIDEFRISKGIARWTSAFTPQTITYNPDTYTKLLLHFDEVDASTVCTDSETTPKTATAVGTAQVDTAQYRVLDMKFGTASCLLDGTGDYVSLLDSEDWDFNGDFTIDLWVKWLSVGNSFIMGNGNTTGWAIYYSGGNLYFYAANATRRTEAFTPTVNTWYHIAVVRATNEIYIYVNGATAGHSTYATAISSANELFIGRDHDTATYLNGRVEEVRISKGYARWTADFSTALPSTPYAMISSTEITTTYLEADVPNLHYAQNNDVLYIVHPDYAPRKLSRTSATAFSLSTVSFVRGPFLDTNITVTTITPSADTGAGITLTSSVAVFDETHVNSLWRVKDGVVKITAVASGGLKTTATADVQAEPDGTAGDLNTGPAAVTDWAEGAFSGYRGYPSTVAFHEQRLYYANTDHEPQKLWGSYIGAYDNFDDTATTANYAITYEVATEQRNEILWLSSGNLVLNIGTTGGTFSASSGDSSEPISPTNVMINRDTNYGCAALLPKRISSFLYYVQRDYQKLRELSYSFQIDSTISSDMTLFAEHILKDGTSVVDLDHQQAPNDRIWCVRDDGEIAVLTRNAEQEVMGWCRIVAGDDAQGAGEFESICVIPKAQADDQVWVICKRVIDGTTKRYIEYFTTENFDEDWDAVQCDCSLTLDSPKTITAATAADPVVITSASHGFSNGDQVKINGVVGMTELNGEIFLVADKADDTFELTDLDGNDIDGSAYTAYISGGEVRKMVTAISGLGHLAGETVVAQVDGYIPSTETYVVSAGGAITLSAKAAVVHVGLPYEGTLQLLKFSDGSPRGTGQTQMRRVYLMTLRVDRTQGLSVGRNETDLNALIYDVDGAASTALYTGDVERPFTTSWSKDDELLIRQTKPLPADILCVILESEIS